MCVAKLVVGRVTPHTHLFVCVCICGGVLSPLCACRCWEAVAASVCISRRMHIFCSVLCGGLAFLCLCVWVSIHVLKKRPSLSSFVEEGMGRREGGGGKKEMDVSVRIHTQAKQQSKGCT